MKSSIVTHHKRLAKRWALIMLRYTAAPFFHLFHPFIDSALPQIAWLVLAVATCLAAQHWCQAYGFPRETWLLSGNKLMPRLTVTQCSQETHSNQGRSANAAGDGPAQSFTWWQVSKTSQWIVDMSTNTITCWMDKKFQSEWPTSQTAGQKLEIPRFSCLTP